MSTNLFARIKALLPGAPLLVATVVSSSAGVSVVELPGGSRLTVRGSASVSTKVFMRAGNIEGPAPNLSEVDIDV